MTRPTPSPNTMTAAVIAQLRKGWTTPLDALRECGCMSLAQRVSLDMQHLNVQKRWHSLPNGKRVMAYRIVRAKK